MISASPRRQIKRYRVIGSFGGDSKTHCREHHKELKAVASDTYSPLRVTAASKLLPELKFMPGFAVDLPTADADGRL